MWILKYTEKKNKNAIITSDSSVVESSSDLMGWQLTDNVLIWLVIEPIEVIWGAWLYGSLSVLIVVEVVKSTWKIKKFPFSTLNIWIGFHLKRIFQVILNYFKFT